MKIKQFEYVCEIAKCQSITTAAQNLFISQQALSETLKLLEQELNFSIFDRTKKGVTLTAEGELFLKDAEKILAMVYSWEDLASRQNKKSTVKIVVQNLLRDLILIDNLKESIEQRGNFDLSWETSSVVNIMKQLLSNRPCIGLVFSSPQYLYYSRIVQFQLADNYIVKCIADEKASEMQLLLHNDDPLAHRADIQLADLRGKRLVVNEGVHKTKMTTQLTSVTATTPYVLPPSVNIVDFVAQRKGYFAYLPKFIVQNNVHVLNHDVAVGQFLHSLDEELKCYLISNFADEAVMEIICGELSRHLLKQP